MATYNRYGTNNANLGGANQQNKGFFNRMLRNISSFGMNYDDMLIRNTYSVGINEDPRDVMLLEPSTHMYDLFSKKVIAKMLDQKSIAYLDRAYLDKRKILRQYSIKDEIKLYLSDIADETVIFNDDNYFCKMKDLPDEFDNTIKQKYQENFKRIYNDFRFNDSITAWIYFKNLLIDGYISYEIIYDNKQKNVIGIQPIDPITLIPATDPESGTVCWVQYPDNPQLRRILLDAQIIYISYSNANDYSETSYVENLIRPYNQLKLVEQTRLLYNINQAAIYKKFIIPTGGLTRAVAEQQILQLMSEYHEEVTWDETMGTVSINGSTAIPHSKDFWFPSSPDGGQPDMQIMAAQGTDLNEDSMLKWFYNNLKRATKIPFSRFETETGGGNVFNDAAEMTRDEIKFGTFIKRLRTLFREILIKPLRIQMFLDFPELKDDILFNSTVQIIFNSNDLFEEWKYLNNLAKRADIASTLNSNLQDAEGKPYLHIEFIVRKIMKLTDADIQENNKYKMLGGSGASGTGEPSEGGGGGAGGEFGGEFGGGGAGGGFGGQAQGGAQTQGGAQGGAQGGQTPQAGGQTPQGGGQTPQAGGGQAPQF
jgi:hypothetical protein